MITRICRSLIQHTHRLLIKLHKVPLERQVTNPRLIVLAITPIILKEQRQTPRYIELGPFDWYLLHLGCLTDLKDLGSFFLRRRVEIHRILVDEDFECFGRGWRGGSSDYDGVEADLACEGNGHKELLVCAAFQLGFRVEALRPCLLADCATAVRLIFVEGDEFAEVDLFVEDVLQSGSYVIAMIVPIAAVVVVLVVAVRVVVVMRHVKGVKVVVVGWWGRGSLSLKR